MSSQKAAFVGLSHVGLVTSIAWASLGHKSLGIDLTSNIIDSLNKGVVPHTEPGLDKLYRKAKKNVCYSEDFQLLKEVKTVFITQDTELVGKDRLFILNKLIDKAIPNLTRGVTIVLISQVPVGYTRLFYRKIKTQRPLLRFKLYHWIDTIIMTKAIDCFLKPSRIIIGSETNSKPLSREIQSALKNFRCPVFTMSWESAEITKAFINLYLANSVMFANTLSDYCENLGGDINEVIPALQSDRRIGQFAYLRPNLRISGGHLERDLAMLKTLATKKHIQPGVVDSILKQDKERYKWIEKQINKLFPKKRKLKVAIWGLAYKKDSDSTLNAPSIKIIESLLKNGHKISVYDPMAKLPNSLKNVNQVNEKHSSLRLADCLIILTAWHEFTKPDFRKMHKLMRTKLIVDVPGLYSGYENLKGFNYVLMGRS